MPTMSKERMGEIALFLVKHKMRGSIYLQDLKRDLGNSQQKIGVPVNEATIFAELVIRELVDEAFKK